MSLSEDSHEFCIAFPFFSLFKVLKKKYQLLFVIAQHNYLNPLLTCVINVYVYEQCAVGYLEGYVSHTSVWGKQLTENRDEHLSLTGP